MNYELFYTKQVCVNSCVFVVTFNYLCALGLSRQSLLAKADVLCGLNMNSFMQNKPNFQNAQSNVTSDQITSYQLPVTNYQYAKQTQSNPNKANFRRKLAKAVIRKVNLICG